MACLPDFPCYFCHSDVCRLDRSVRMDHIFPDLFAESVYLANVTMGKPLGQYKPVDFSQLNEIEWVMYVTILRMQGRFFQKHPNKLNVSIEQVNDFSDICPILEEKLGEVVKTTLELGEFNVLRHEMSLAGILPMPYQCIVLESLIVAGKFTVLCMHKFEEQSDAIFNSVLNTLLRFFDESNVTSWILHTSMIMHPFGSVGYAHQQAITQTVDNICHQFRHKM